MRQPDSKKGNVNRIKVSGVLIVITALLICGCGGFRPNLIDESTIMSPRMTHFGLSLPYPLWLPIFEPDSNSVGEVVKKAEKIYPLTLVIDEQGLVASLTAEQPDDSVCVATHYDYLMAARFGPGLKNGEPHQMLLSVLLHGGNQENQPRLYFPVEPNRAVIMTDLYWKSLAANGVETASLARFPSYFYDFEGQERWRQYPLKIYRVELDSTGDVTSTSLVRATSPIFNKRIRMAIHWGTYEPMRIDGQAVASSNFLVFSLFPSVEYPTRAIDFSSPPDRSVWERLRVRLVADTIGLLAPPVPKRDWSGRIENPFNTGMTRELVSCQIKVDTVGLTRVSNVRTDFWRARRALISRAHDNPFYPARSFTGTTYPFNGLIYLKYIDASIIRIWFSWIPYIPSEATR